MSRGAQSGTTTYDVFIGNLPPDANEKIVSKHFSSFGEIQSLTVLNNKNGSGKLSFVRFYTEADADNACQQAQGLNIGGQKVVVRKAKKPGTNGFGGGNRKNGRGGQDNQSWPDTASQSDLSDQRSQGSDSDLSRLGVEVNREEQVLVTHVESVICVWVQTMTEQRVQALRSMTNKLTQTCPAAPKVKGSPVMGKNYATTFSQDNMWYRCAVKQLHSMKGKVKVLYVDFGNMEEKAIDELVEIPQSLANVKPFARKIVLHGLAVKNNSDSQAGIQFLQENTEGQILLARLTTPLRDNMGSYGDLVVNNCSISDLALKKGFVTRRSMLPTKPATTRSPSSAEGSPQRTTLTNSFLPSSDRNRSSRNEVAEYKMWLEKEKAEKDMMSLELASLKGKLKSLQAEHTTPRTGEVGSLDLKIQNIGSLVQKVAHLRHQFPSDEGTQDCLTTSLSMAFADDHISLDSITSLRCVNEALESYTSSQQAIKACKSQEELSGLISHRDARRQDLHASFQVFLDESSKMPLDERMTKVKSVLSSIEESYSGFIHFIINNQPGIGEAKTMYDEWRAKVLTGFQEVREQTDTIKQTLTSTLFSIQQLVSMEDIGTTPSTNFDLEGLCKTYITALQKELTVTDVQHSNEACQMASIIHEVKRVFEKELKIIESVKCLATEFTRQKNTIEEWLDDKPDLQDIRNVKKTLRSMKSKLRHLLADQEDLDENDSGSDGERTRIESALAVLKLDLQKALLTEEDLMMKYSQLADDHFPELKLIHPDLNLDLCQTYSGMCKTSRELDHYSLVSDAHQHGAYTVTFAEIPAILKEYVMDDRIHTSKEEFLQRALQYSHVTSPYLLPVEAVFMSKNQRQMYLQTQASGISLLHFVEQEDLKPWVIQKILRSVTAGLRGLHEAGITHGGLSPESVMIADGGLAQLSVPDFSRPATDASRSWFVTTSGLEFKAPEEDRLQAPLPTADLFHLGLLCLWIHFPHTQLPRNPSGIPELRDLLISEDVLQVIQSVLRVQPSSRVTACEVLQAEYFRTTIPEIVPVDTVRDLPEETHSLDEAVSEAVVEDLVSLSEEQNNVTTPLTDVTTPFTDVTTPFTDVTTPFTDVTTPLTDVGTPVETSPCMVQESETEALSEEAAPTEASCPDSVEPSQGNATEEPLISLDDVSENGGLESLVSQFSDGTVDSVEKAVPELEVENYGGEASPPLTNGTTVETPDVLSANTMLGASLEPIQATVAALAQQISQSNCGVVGAPSGVGADLDGLLMDSPGPDGDFLMDKHGVESPSSVIPPVPAQIPPQDGSGDGQEAGDSITSARVMDNDALIQNLLNFTAQYPPKNIGF